jgi:hypothetical protein
MVKEKRSAEAMYLNATQQGRMAVLLQQSERTFDTFKVGHWKNHMIWNDHWMFRYMWELYRRVKNVE